jgi:hypothetical protein
LIVDCDSNRMMLLAIPGRPPTHVHAASFRFADKEISLPSL